MSRVPIGSHELRILVETVKLAEELKPSQQAKRMVFRKYKIIGTEKDRVLTALFYDIMKRLGIIDKIISDVTGISNILILDPWLRAALRVAVDLLLFNKVSNTLKNLLKWKVADYISSMTHPYVGMYYWEVFDKISSYELRPRSKDEELEFKYLLPLWLISKIKEIVRSDEEMRKLLQAFNTKLPLSIRINILKTNVNEVFKELEREGKKPRISLRVPTIIKFEGPYDFDNSKLFREGKIIIQEEAAAVASLILGPKPGETIIDMCAAPGGKSEHMAELMKNKGKIYAFDIDKLRIKRMKQLLRRSGISIVKIYEEDVNKAPKILGEEIADRVMLDAPCTASGTLMKNPELRWRLRPGDIEEITKLQYKLLETAIKLVRPGGVILYCTCSIFPEENEDLIRKILKKHNELRLVPIKDPYLEGFLPGTMRAWPHKHETIGFFYALLKKKDRA
ncbi:MAG: Fmu (Sun) domain-containing protein [Thermoprotei archaeon]|nr:MAG: Fmu (Sun) domain-containing protein [Thermoprotei archaeon]